MNDTYNRILSLINYYIRLGKPIDKNYIYELINMVIEQECLQDYVTKLNSYSAGKGIIFTPVTGQIGIDTVSLRKKIYSKEQISQEKGIVFQYLEATKLILKELEHAKQLRDCDSRVKKDLQTKILRLSYSKYIKLIQEHSNTRQNEEQLDNQWKTSARYPALTPEERLANLTTYDILDNIIKDLQLKTKFIDVNELNKIILTPYLYARENGYTSPTICYLRYLSSSWKEAKEIGKIEEESRHLSEIEKLRLGLPNKIEKQIHVPRRQRVLIMPEKNCQFKNVVLQ